MMRFRLIAVLYVFSLAIECLAADTWTVRPDGIGPVRVGMKLQTLTTDLHLHYSISYAMDSDQKTCFYVNLKSRPGISLMILEGRVARVDINNQQTQTAEGIHNGDSEADALRAYGKRLRIAPDAYTGPEGHDLTLHSTDGRYGIRFVTDAGKVTHIYAGTAEAIEYIEGCE